MPYCGDTTLVKREGDQRDARVMRCKSWHCPDCNPRRCKRLVAELVGGSPNAMITLTVRRKPGDDPHQHAQALSHAWRIIRLRAMRKYKTKTLPFMAVFEATKAGTPHLHILARVKWIDQKWLSEQTAELLNSPICDVRRIDSKGRVAAYVSKYVGKAPTQFGKCKRYWKSQDYEQREDRLKQKEKIAGVWYERYDYHLARLVQQWKELDFSIEFVSADHVRARPPPGFS